jgi:hypothetical protein
MAVGGNQHAVDMQVKELLLVGADGGGDRRRHDGGLQLWGRLGGLGPTANEEFVVNVLRGKGVEGEPGVTAQVRTLWGVAQNICP